MVYGVCGVWCLVYGVWCMVYGVWGFCVTDMPMMDVYKQKESGPLFSLVAFIEVKHQ